MPRSLRALAVVLSLVALAAVVGRSPGAAEPSPQSAPGTGTATMAPLQLIDVPGDDAVPGSPVPAPATAPTRSGSPSAAPGVAPVSPVDALTPPAVLVRGPQSFSPGAVARLVALAPGSASVTFRAGAVRAGSQDVAAVGVDPSQFRPFTAPGTASADAVWQAVARGELVASHAEAKRLGLSLGATVRLEPAGGGALVPVRLGALATTGLPDADLVLDDGTARRLGLRATTGMLLSAGGTDPVELAASVRRVTGTGASVDLLETPTAPTAFLTGGAAAKAFGAFSYRFYADGTIQPDAAWVRTNIVTTDVPILGRVTCHRLMIPQLRGALNEIEAAGKADTLHTYNGCYVPRFIERNPEGSISMHTWGIAIDLDAATNYRGIRGTMDPEVVRIFKKWGFRWGGDWTYTDPMHFEMVALIKG